MSLDPGALYLFLPISGIGFVLFVYGKKQNRWPQLIALIVYSYLVDNGALSIAIAVDLRGMLARRTAGIP